jgi:MbtH protein
VNSLRKKQSETALEFFKVLQKTFSNAIKTLDTKLQSCIFRTQNVWMEMPVFDDENREFVVVSNAEEQYSLWPADRLPPCGWTDIGVKGNKAACLQFVDANWTDMRPLSLRQYAATNSE